MNYKNVKDYFNSKAADWDKTVNHNSKKINLILQITNLKSNSKILDIGSGTGILIEFLEKYNPEQIVELDLSKEMLKQARKKYNYSNLLFLNENFYNCNLKDFDYLICYSGYPHFIDKDLFCKKTYETLSENGRFVIAHSQNKNKINKVHQKSNVNKISRKLNNAFEEAKIFKKNFKIDIIVDTEELFIISGIKKQF